MKLFTSRHNFFILSKLFYNNWQYLSIFLRKFFGFYAKTWFSYALNGIERGKELRTGENIRKRKNGRWEARIYDIHTKEIPFYLCKDVPRSKRTKKWVYQKQRTAFGYFSRNNRNVFLIMVEWYKTPCEAIYLC